MVSQLAGLSVRLEKILAELDQFQFHLPAIYVARAIEAIKPDADERDAVGLFFAAKSGSEFGAPLN